MTVGMVLTLLIVIFAFAAFDIYRTNKREAYLNAAWETLKSEGYDAFEAKLMSDKIRRALGTRKINFLLLKAAMQVNDIKKVEKLVDSLNGMPMRKREFVEYNMSVLGFAVSSKNKEMAKTASDALQRPFIRKGIAAEAKMVYDIYILHSTEYLNTLENFAAKCKAPSGKATAYFRLAKEYYYLNDLKQCEAYLDLSERTYPNPEWKQVIQEVRNSNYTQLE